MIYDLIIIGAGPTGVSSTLYATSRGLNTLVIEECEKAGGTLKKVSNITHFAGFPSGESGQEISRIWTEQLKNSTAETTKDKIIKTSLQGDIKTVIGENNTYQAKSVIIAAGTTQNVPEIKASNKILHDHLHNDAAKDKNKYTNAVVIGGSDGAAKEALYLAENLEHVDMIVHDEILKSVPEFSNPIENKENITVHLHSEILSAKGENEIESVTIKDLLTGETKEIQQTNSGIFYYIGAHPNTSAFEEVEKENDFIKTTPQMETNIKGVYAAGDITVKEIRQISTSVSDGAVAGIQVSKYVKQK